MYNNKRYLVRSRAVYFKEKCAAHSSIWGKKKITLGLIHTAAGQVKSQTRNCIQVTHNIRIRRMCVCVYSSLFPFHVSI
jgi:hypothetical protein